MLPLIQDRGDRDNEMTQENEGTTNSTEVTGQTQREAEAAPPAHAINDAGRHTPRNGYFSKPKNWVALLTLIAVSIYTAITILLWCNSTKQVAVSRDTEIRQLRAYVFLSNVHIRVDDAKNNLLEIDLAVKNFGSTPASDYFFWTCTALREFPLTSPLQIEPRDLKPLGKSVLAPGDIRYIHNPDVCDDPPRRQGGGIPAEERALLQSGKKAIYVYGTLHYKDAWNESRWTHFRLFTNDQFRMNEGKYADLAEGNDYY
jgi:hypothetical protein